VNETEKNDLIYNMKRLANDALTLPTAFPCCLLDNRGASTGTNFSAIANPTKRTNQEREQSVDVVSGPGARLQEVTPP
jgi:hypothetical protein